MQRQNRIFQKIMNNHLLTLSNLIIFCCIITLLNINGSVAVSNVNTPSSELSLEEAKQIQVIMQTMMPSMFSLFSNITSAEYKTKFKDPCRFDVLMDIFKNLPPYFDIIATEYQNKDDLIAYYSMQLASSFLVNNGSLTMACMYNMLSLQTKLFSFSLDIMDNPEKNPQLVGLFGIFMKPVMTMLKKNSMMKIIEHVDRYDKNEEQSTIKVFHIFNFIFIFFGTFAILSNILLIILLKRVNETSTRHRISRSNQNNTNAIKSPLNTPIIDKKKRRLFEVEHIPDNSKYQCAKESNSRLLHLVRKRYKTRFCFIVIAICHSLYLLINFMIMSQASLAAAALKGLSKFNIMCKLAFFMSPPTTVYNILHQLAIWLLVYAIRQHGIKLRKIITYNNDSGDNELEMMKIDDYANDQYDMEDDKKAIDFEIEVKESYDNKKGKASAALMSKTKNIMMISQSEEFKTSTVDLNKFKLTPDEPSFTNYHQILTNPRHPILQFTPITTQMPSTGIKKLKPLLPVINYEDQTQISNEKKEAPSFCKNKNVLFCLVLFMLICVYDSHNFFFYSLKKLENKKQTLYFCAFESYYADYYTVLNQHILPIANLILFSILPLLLCTIQVINDLTVLIRLKREQIKRYDRLKDLIEWPLYAYYVMYLISQLPLGLHQVIDLVNGTVKFPFVFPLFIQLKFTSKVWLNVTEMTLIFICYSSDLYIWILCDKQVRKLAAYWLNKRIFCRTYKKKRVNFKNNEFKNDNMDDSSSVGSTASYSENCSSSSESFSFEKCNQISMIDKNEKETKSKVAASVIATAAISASIGTYFNLIKKMK